MSKNKPKDEPSCLLERLNENLDSAKESGIPKDAAMVALFAMEMQILENRILALEEELDQIRSETVHRDYSQE